MKIIINENQSFVLRRLSYVDEIMTTKFESIYTNKMMEYNCDEYDNETFGTLPITLIATSPDGCLDTSIVFILINEENICYVPNTFSPNGDEFNNEFLPIITSGYDHYNYNLLIFNRWGEIVFESKDTEQGWDGSYNGTLVQSGGYTWKISLKNKNTDDRKIIIGTLTVIR